MSAATTSVAVVGLQGYGRAHLARLDELERRGNARLVAGCDVNPDAREVLAEHATFYPEHRSMLAECAPQVVIIATPPHTHLDIARDAIEAGSDVLLEKPPVVSMAEHVSLVRLCRRLDRRCQVGFQHLVSRATRMMLRLVGDHRLGTVTDVVVTAPWVRTDRYYERSRWAGRRRLDGVVIADGVATNPLAHPVMNALAILHVANESTWPTQLDAEAYRCRDNDADDTLSARIRMSDGHSIHLAVTLCAEAQADAAVTVKGSEATAELIGGTELRIDGIVAELPGGDDHPLDDLLEHRRDPAHRRLAIPLERTAPFTAVLEGMLNSGEPRRIPQEFLEERVDSGTRRVVLRGVDALIARSGVERALFSELGAPWARPPVSVALGVDPSDVMAPIRHRAAAAEHISHE